MPVSLQTPPFDPGTVWLVGAGPGDPGLLTLNALAALEEADVILHDALVAPEILALASAGARIESVGKRAGRRSAKQLQINERVIQEAKRGQRVLRLKNGDPFVFGRGGEEARALAASGVCFRVVPGITAGTAAPAYAGIPVTHRTLSQSVAFATGHHAGGGPSRSVDWAALARGGTTLVLYMALRRLPEIAAALLAAGRNPSEPVALLDEATTRRQRTRTATLEAVAAREDAAREAGPTLIVIGPTVALREELTPWQQVEPAFPVAAPAAVVGGAERCQDMARS